MKILLAGDIVGAQGRACFARVAARMRASGEADFIVANAENSAGGKGVTGAVAEEILASGADVLTLGDHTWDQHGIEQFLEKDERIVRPANFAPGCPGRGWTLVRTKKANVAVLSLIGRVFMPPADCPFRTADAVIEKARKQAGILIVDFHAEATSEKIALGRYVDGRSSVFAGTHTHVQTSDETILPGGTAYITDLGMTGPKDSALGRDLASITARFLNGMPAKYLLATKDAMLEGVVVEVDETGGRARNIKRIRAAS
jgi:metallophosphoesterase (TIGR00282 family)